MHSLKTGVESTVAGGTGGTLLVLFAQNLKSDNQWRSWCVLAAPSVTMGVRFLYQWARTALKERADKRNLTGAINDMEATLKAAIDDPTTSEEHRTAYRAQLHTLRQERFEIMQKQIHALAAASSEATPS